MHREWRISLRQRVLPLHPWNIGHWLFHEDPQAGNSLSDAFAMSMMNLCRLPSAAALTCKTVLQSKHLSNKKDTGKASLVDPG